MRCLMMGLALASLATPALAQEAAGLQTDVEWQAWVPDPALLQMPELAFVEDQEDIDNYEKYFYFHRSDTSFEIALADLRECDAHARGLYRGDWYQGMTQSVVMYGAGGLVGGLIGGAIADAVFGSAQLRLNRRINMRRCMYYKGYARFGIDKGLWEEFNLEGEGGSMPESERQTLIARQALVASGTRPMTQEMGL